MEESNVSNLNGKLGTDDEVKLLRGNFFCTTADVWSVQYKKSSRKHWDAFWRSGDVSIKGRQDQQGNEGPLDYYKATRDAIDEGMVPAPIKSTRSESTGSGTGKVSEKQIIWPVDIVGNPIKPSQEIAHLLPAGYLAHEEWFGVVAAVMGLKRDATIREQLMATRGVMKEDNDNQNDDVQTGTPLPAAATTMDMRESPTPPAANKKAKSEPKQSGATPPSTTTNPRKRAPPHSDMKNAKCTKRQKTDSNVSFDEESISQTSSAARKQRVNNTGVVHFVSNKIRLELQSKIADGKSPTMLIIPCMTLDEARKWRGEGYKAAILTGFPAGLANIPEEYKTAYPGRDCPRMLRRFEHDQS
jgi:hypothetical protein